MSGDHVGDVRRRAVDVVTRLDPAKHDTGRVLQAWFEQGLTWVDFPEGRGGLGLPRFCQAVADEVLVAAGGILPRLYNRNACGFVAPTLVDFANPTILDRHLAPIASGEQRWCQLFSEPGAGSDLAALGTTARRENDGWRITGQKVWSSKAYLADWGILLARTDPDVPKHRGITYFIVDMRSPGIEVRALRQATGRAEFNEVFLDDLLVPDEHRIGAEGEGWAIARATLAYERMSVADRHAVAGRASPLQDTIDTWHARPERQTPARRDALCALWARAEAHRLTCDRLRGAPDMKGSEGSVAKISGSRLNQELYELSMALLGPDATLYGSYDPNGEEDAGYLIQERFLRSRANTIEGGTIEIQRNLVAERILGLPAELRPDRGLSWRESRRG